MTSKPDDRFNVVIAGGGVAAIETALALRELAGGLVKVTLLAPEPDLVYRPMTVREPFAYAAAERYPLAEIAGDLGATLLIDRFAWVDAPARIAHTDANVALPYDALVLASGAHAHARYEHALTIDDRRLDEQLHGLIQDIEDGYVHSLAFIMPTHKAWPLPIYELALMTAARAYDANAKLDITVITSEDSVLAIFGEQVSAGVGELLSRAGVTVLTNASAEVPSSGTVTVNPGDRQLTFDRVVALPEILGPAIRGLPVGDDGFIPIDRYCRVRGVNAVYAAGDATDFLVKFGGIAAEQADTVATSIAALAGARVEPAAFDPVLRGILLTGERPRYLSARLTAGKAYDSHFSATPSWSPPAKIAATYLAPYLERLGRSEAPVPTTA